MPGDQVEAGLELDFDRGGGFVGPVGIVPGAVEADVGPDGGAGRERALSDDGGGGEVGSEGFGDAGAGVPAEELVGGRRRSVGRVGRGWCGGRRRPMRHPPRRAGGGVCAAALAAGAGIGLVGRCGRFRPFDWFGLVGLRRRFRRFSLNGGGSGGGPVGAVGGGELFADVEVPFVAPGEVASFQGVLAGEGEGVAEASAASGFVDGVVDVGPAAVAAVAGGGDGGDGLGDGDAVARATGRGRGGCGREGVS